MANMPESMVPARARLRTRLRFFIGTPPLHFWRVGRNSPFWAGKGGQLVHFCTLFSAQTGAYDSPDRSPAGLCTVQPVTWETCAYTARYVTKKLDGPYAKFYEEHNIDPPFCVMSRRPGIGRQYYEDHPDLWNFEYLNVSTPDGGKKFPPPRYYMKCLEKDDPEKAEALKEIRKKMVMERQAILDDMVEIPHFTYLHQQEENKLAKIKSLERSSV